jgi:hypothetical protein
MKRFMASIGVDWKDLALSTDSVYPERFEVEALQEYVECPNRKHNLSMTIAHLEVPCALQYLKKGGRQGADLQHCHERWVKHVRKLVHAEKA